MWQQQCGSCWRGVTGARCARPLQATRLRAGQATGPLPRPSAASLACVPSAAASKVLRRYAFAPGTSAADLLQNADCSFAVLLDFLFLVYMYMYCTSHTGFCRRPCCRYSVHPYHSSTSHLVELGHAQALPPSPADIRPVAPSEGTPLSRRHLQRSHRKRRRQADQDFSSSRVRKSLLPAAAAAARRGLRPLLRWPCIVQPALHVICLPPPGWAQSQRPTVHRQLSSAGPSEAARPDTARPPVEAGQCAHRLAPTAHDDYPFPRPIRPAYWPAVFDVVTCMY